VFVEDIVCLENVQNVNEFRGRLVTAAECITNEMLSSIFLMCVVPVIITLQSVKAVLCTMSRASDMWRI